MFELRAVRGVTEVSACQALQRDVWGTDHQLPSSVFVMLDKIGGIVIGAFDQDLLLGFVLSFPAVFMGEHVQWSDMLAVRPTCRDGGIGRALKIAQREAATRAGFDTILWTFDPLESRNAWFNFGRLGVTAAHYEVDMYGDLGGMFGGLPSDRLIVAWRVGEVRAPATPGAVHTIEIPPDIQDLKSRDPSTALRWRLQTRRKFQAALAAQYCVVGFDREESCYRLERQI